MSDADEPIHEHLVELAALPAGGRAVDLGCGAGPTLAAFARVDPKSTLVGLDRSEQALREAARLLAGHDGEVVLALADLRERLPLPQARADAVVSYNVLECVPEPERLVSEAARLLRPGGRAVFAHVDFDSVMLAGADQTLDRRICHAFADDQQSWMDHVDGRIGRKLPGLVHTSDLVLDEVVPRVASSRELTGLAARRVESIRTTVAQACRRGSTDLTESDVDQWYAALQHAAATGRFFFAETTVTVAAHRP
ncbi:methyltransferase domain-containing protein [Kitasatospora sp. NBC_01560]|uniref:methyltransferase domain-containing protein n=1 Tax=Kitasatospora sp. NBC_01560 TaxID=2975965 RepID=UPI00386C81B9